MYLYFPQKYAPKVRHLLKYYRYKNVSMATRNLARMSLIM